MLFWNPITASYRGQPKSKAQTTKSAQIYCLCRPTLQKRLCVVGFQKYHWFKLLLACSFYIFKSSFGLCVDRAFFGVHRSVSEEKMNFRIIYKQIYIYKNYFFLYFQALVSILFYMVGHCLKRTTETVYLHAMVHGKINLNSCVFTEFFL